MSTTDEALAQAVIDHFHAPDDTHSSWWLNIDELRHAFVPILAAHDAELRAWFAEQVRELSRQGYSAQEAANKIERDA